jgi:Fe-S cluster assembly protein SufD
MRGRGTAHSVVEGVRGGDGDAAVSAVVDFPVKPEARPYLDRFFQVIEPARPQAVHDVLQRNLARFSELGFPSRKSEGWRYIDLESLKQNPLFPPSLRHKDDLQPGRALLAQLGLPDADLRLVLVDGLFIWDLSKVSMTGEAGFWFGSVGMAYAESNGAALERELFSNVIEDISGQATNPFAALNAAFFADGYILDVPAGTVVERPIEVIHLASGENQASFHTRSLIRLGEGAQATIVEIYAGRGRYWRNDVARVELGRGAVLHRTALVEEASEAIHLALTDARLAADAQLHGFALLLGGRTVRHEANVTIVGEGAQCRLDGAFIVSGNDEANIVTAVDHAAPGGQTRELIKGVAAGRGHGAFQGCIVVRQDAQKTDAHQLSRSLIIGQRAAIDTKPELEIYADDVKCAHGASVGDLDEAALFYLRARGIPTEEARHMLIDAFLREAVETVEDFAIRTHLLRRLAARLAKLEEGSE